MHQHVKTGNDITKEMDMKMDIFLSTGSYVAHVLRLIQVHVTCRRRLFQVQVAGVYFKYMSQASIFHQVRKVGNNKHDHVG